MTDAAWRGSTLLGTTRAGDLIQAISRVRCGRSKHLTSPLSGTMLYFSGGNEVTVWSCDGARLVTTSFELAESGGAAWTAVVGAGFLEALRDIFDRHDTVQIGGREKSTKADGSLLLRRPDSQRTLVQPTWLDSVHIEAFNTFVAGSAPVASLRVESKDLGAAITSAPPHSTLALTASPGELHLGVDGPAAAAVLTAPNSWEPQTVMLHRALLLEGCEAVTNLKLPVLQIDTVPDRGLLKLYGVSRSEPPMVGQVTYWMRIGEQRSHDATPQKGAGPIPGEASIDEPTAGEPLDLILRELDEIVGQSALKKQVAALVNQVEISRIREQQGLKAGPMAAHMVFSGPPGTGKTTVARLIARLLHSLGVLESAEVHEVARPDLVSQNVGGTEEKTAAAISDALGGVLFIDEVYTLAQGGENDFGKQAIDVLLKELEDRRGEFVCIVAGYTDHMREFLESNPGLKSRFPRTIDFVPYSCEELAAIARSMAHSRDNRLSEAGEQELVDRLYSEQRRGGFDRKEWGNARAVRNIVELAAQHRDMRISEEGAHDRESLINLEADDIAQACNDLKIGRVTGAAETVEQVLEELEAQIGQPQLKSQVKAIIAQARVQIARQENGLGGGGNAIEHLLFVGPPGTGKTTIARLIARLYRALGLLPNDEIVEVDRRSLVSGFVGQTATQTTKKIDEAIGGVLFIDEAYALAKGGENDFGKEAIDTLLPRLENDKGRFLAIAAGYPDDMEMLLATNVGLRSRFTTRIEFLPYTSDELVSIAELMAQHRHEVFTEDARELLRMRLAAAERAGVFTGKDWGNGRSVRNVLERAVQQRDLRVSEGDYAADPQALVTLTADDVVAACDVERIGGADARETPEQVLAELETQIGQPQLKQQVLTLLAAVRAAKARQEHGIAEGVIDIPHLLFSGPPGTGKTTIARLLARLYTALGLLPRGQVIEVDRAALVAGYVGQTAEKTSRAIDSAMGGVLFIDEAYTLAPKNENDFGGEAIDTLLKRMSDDQGRFLVIAAGYPDQMRSLLNSNPGLTRRFATQIEFSPYSAEELTRIAQHMAVRRKERITDEAVALLHSRLEAAQSSGVFAQRNWGNAGTVENILTKAISVRNTRIFGRTTVQPSRDELTTIEASDLVAGCETYGV